MQKTNTESCGCTFGGGVGRLFGAVVGSGEADGVLGCFVHKFDRRFIAGLGVLGTASFDAARRLAAVVAD